MHLARQLDWSLSYVDEEQAFPRVLAGEPWLSQEAWKDWDEPYKTSFGEYVRTQAAKERAVEAVADALGQRAGMEDLDPAWLGGVKLHGAALPLAEFLAVVGNLRAARFGRAAAWRTMATFGALDECRHAQIPLSMLHPLVKWDEQFDWAHRFYHTDCWVAIAARRLFDELLLLPDPIEFAIGTHFVFETGFTNLQFVGLASLADRAGDRAFQTMLGSIQTDEARHAQIGLAVLEVVAKHDPERAQYLLDKWFWRSWLLFAILTGFSMDYLTPLEARTRSFKEFMEEWIVEQFLDNLAAFGLEKPWYWDTFLSSLEHYHHIVYASAYSYRSTVWFPMAVPGPEERAWLAWKYPDTWPAYEPIWERIAERWAKTDPGVDFGVHSTAIVSFCNLCNIVLCHGTPEHNDARVVLRDGRKHIFCSEPCQWIFEQEPERYAEHLDLVKRVLGGIAPGNLVELLTRYCDLTFDTWGKDAYEGRYPWLERDR